MTEEEKPDVQPIAYGTKTYDANTLSEEQMKAIGASQQINTAITFVTNFLSLMNNLENIKTLANIGHAKVMEENSKTFPAPLELPKAEAASSETLAPATLTADDAKETAEQSDSGEVASPEPEGKTH
tara:strand:- start:90 stop:470 length:381 start_codon:yes stop_codon:yes gene_type:complete